ncbi:SIS domain-containing protein [Patescibacteria group bacterium]|nr:SIS domain-containing protein [Patescibacteria group bacterium]
MKIVETIVTAFLRGNKLLICGNGGSAAEAQHMAGELVGKFKLNRKGLPAIALTTDTSIITSIGNDISFDSIFSRQVEALGKPGDVLLCISSSGRSWNVNKAGKMALEICMEVIDLPREGKDTPEIQENQLKLIHTICEQVEKEMYENWG